MRSNILGDYCTYIYTVYTDEDCLGSFEMISSRSVVLLSLMDDTLTYMVFRAVSYNC